MPQSATEPWTHNRRHHSNESRHRGACGTQGRPHEWVAQQPDDQAAPARDRSLPPPYRTNRRARQPSRTSLQAHHQRDAHTLAHKQRRTSDGTRGPRTARTRRRACRHLLASLSAAHPEKHPHAEHLGRLLRQLHQLPQPPITLPKWTPLTSFTQTLAHANSVPDTQKDWLATRAHELIATFEELDYALTPGLVHGDVYPGNCLWDGDHTLLGDWDEAAVGPREVDLANT
ncbi:aminoglycoside phosphotransferase family protein [Streptomyces sp. NPDC056358]